MNKIALAPTTLPYAPAVDYVRAAEQAGYDGIGIRLYPSPVFPDWKPIVGDPPLMRDVKSAIQSSGLEVYDVLSFYLQEEKDRDKIQASLDFGKEIGARYALVIGSDSQWGRMVDSFGRFCDTCASLDLVAAIEAPVRALSPLATTLKLIAEAGRSNGVVCLDPLALFNAGDRPDVLEGQDPQLFPYTQITDGTSPGERCRPGDGSAQVSKILDLLPAELPLSLEWPAPKGSDYAAADWAKQALEGTKRFLDDYYASKRSAVGA